MKFSCEKTLLQQAVSAASRAVASKSSIPALEGILMEGDMNLVLSGYNMQTGIRTAIEAQIHEAGRIVLNAKLFGDIIRKMPDDVIVFSADEKLVVHLSCGDASFDILGLSAEDYPELPEVDDQFSVALEQRTLRAMISQTAFAVSTNESRPVHTGSLFEIDDNGLTMVSVDGFRLALRREPLERMDGGAFRFVAPGSALREVESICSDSDDLITVTQGKRHLLFEAGATQLICRRLEGDFLDYKNAIPRSNPIALEVECSALLQSLDRVSVVISEKLKSPVKCVFDDERVFLSAKTGNGEAKDICYIKGDGKGLEIGFNNRYLMDALRYAPSDKVRMELNTGISPCIITPTDGSDNFLYMVLPVRLKVQ
ncbi:MAG: DNA polymerase III subunit beta [Lachnospiraceae bacterium]|nr:DNA polymerase III subunit beta [Oscillospiraceae bacterium]MBQ6876058.1 DNA polymerase III subunit beta [Lachnospiraceae bacterium]